MIQKVKCVSEIQNILRLFLFKNKIKRRIKFINSENKDEHKENAF